MTAEIQINGERLIADPDGALVWPARRTLVVADLHLEKGTSYGRHGSFLPPYDSRSTLARLAGLAKRHNPRRLIALGDSFHDPDAPDRLGAAERASLEALTRALDWIWIVGNHDPAPPADWGGAVHPDLTEGALVFRHQALPGRAVGEISGHFHPKAAVRVRGQRVTNRCFVSDGRRLILPSFGAYTGGLDVFDPAIASLFDRNFRVHILGRHRVHSLPRAGLRPSPHASAPPLGSTR